MMEYPLHDFQQLGFVELVSTELTAQCMENKHEIVQPLIKTSDGPQFELISHCAIIPPDIPQDDNLSDPFKYEEASERQDANAEYECALRLSDQNTEKPFRLMRSGNLFRDLHQQWGNSADLDKAIAIYKAAVRPTPDGHECQAELLGQLGLVLYRRFKQWGNIVDINDAIFALEHSITLTPDDKFDRLNNLGISFAIRFEHSGDMVDIGKAISIQEQIVHLTPDDHADKPDYLDNLGISFMRHFEHSGDLIDIEKAISIQEQVVNLTDNFRNLNASFE